MSDYYVVLDRENKNADCLRNYRVPIFTSVEKAFKAICDLIEEFSNKIEDASVVEIKNNRVTDYKVTVKFRYVTDDGIEHPLHHEDYYLQKVDVI